jgi:hypothetical protein
VYVSLVNTWAIVNCLRLSESNEYATNHNFTRRFIEAADPVAATYNKILGRRKYLSVTSTHGAMRQLK